MLCCRAMQSIAQLPIPTRQEFTALTSFTHESIARQCEVGFIDVRLKNRVSDSLYRVAPRT
jgi:hypothetical protein